MRAAFDTVDRDPGKDHDMPPPAKPSRRYFVRSVPVRDGFLGEFTFPGKDVQRVHPEDGPLFDDDRYAVAAAGEALCDALNDRTRGTLKHGYQRMGGAEFAAALADLQITPAEFAILYGSVHKRVMDWIDGNEEIPHPVRILLAAFTLPGALQLARQVTSTVTHDRRDR
ncbi:MAG: hypothetical protein KIS96_11530 [Bauldia sp.]|nr:hypothetical protein [Bauldia sp.]